MLNLIRQWIYISTKGKTDLWHFFKGHSFWTAKCISKHNFLRNHWADWTQISRWKLSLLYGVIMVWLCQPTLNWATAWDFQQCVILTSVDSDEPLQPPFKPRNSNYCSVSSLTIIEYSSDLQRLWSDCAYAQADLRLC